jgi:imidazolonepropionase
MGPEFLGRLVESHAAALVLYARQWCSAPEDVVQEAFVKLAGQRPEPDCLTAWLYRVVRNRAVSAARTGRRRQHHEARAGRGEAWFAAADERLDAAGRCVIPGFVDSHTHLVFAGDRADEFAARMAGAPYAAGGIRVTTEATRGASDEQLLALGRARQAEARRAGITHLEIKSGYGLDVESERRLCAIAAQLTDDVTFLGAHVVPAEYDGRADDYVALVCGPMLAACAPHARWIDVFCERGAFDADQSRAVLEAGRAVGLSLVGCEAVARLAAAARPMAPA